MTRRDAALYKINALIIENNQYQQYIKIVESDYEVLTDQYMNGNIEGPIGKEQNRLMRLRDGYMKHIQKNERAIASMRIKYGL